LVSPPKIGKTDKSESGTPVRGKISPKNGQKRKHTHFPREVFDNWRELPHRIQPQFPGSVPEGTQTGEREFS
jgi:hypothetical protein